MKLQKIILENFRCFTSNELDLSNIENPHIIQGNNGIGKTSIIEGIYLLAVLKSFRAKKLATLIKEGMDYFRVTGEFLDSDGNNIKREVFYSIYPRKVNQLKINDIKVKPKDFIGKFLSVVFQPSDLHLFYLAPQNRRSFLDLLLCQMDLDYFLDLAEYKKIIKNKNKLLKQIQEGNANLVELEYWNQKVIDLGSYLTFKRQEVITKLMKNIPKFYKNISGGKDEVKINYHSNLGDINELNLEEIKGIFKDKLAEKANVEVLRGECILGPHRDDIYAFYNGINAIEMCSRGEIRSFILAIKLAEIKLIEKEKGHKPLLLLDDVFSELDESRCDFLKDLLIDYSSIITTT